MLINYQVLSLLGELPNGLRDKLHPLGAADAMFASDLQMGRSEPESRLQGGMSAALSG